MSFQPPVVKPGRSVRTRLKVSVSTLQVALQEINMADKRKIVQDINLSTVNPTPPFFGRGFPDEVQESSTQQVQEDIEYKI